MMSQKNSEVWIVGHELVDIMGASMVMAWGRGGVYCLYKQWRNDCSNTADKGRAVVVWNKDIYIQESNIQLPELIFYLKRRDDPTTSKNHIVKNQVKFLIQEGDIPMTATNLHIYDCNLGKSFKYLLSKIHKLNKLGRPLVSACSRHTVHIF